MLIAGRTIFRTGDVETIQQFVLQCNIEERSGNRCCSGKALRVTCAVCVCSLSYAARNAHASYCLWPAWFYHILPTFSHTQRDMRNKKAKGTEHRMYVLIFSKSFV